MVPAEGFSLTGLKGPGAWLVCQLQQGTRAGAPTGSFKVLEALQAHVLMPAGQPKSSRKGMDSCPPFGQRSVLPMLMPICCQLLCAAARPG